MSRGRPVRRPSDLAWRRLAALDTDPFAPMFYSSIPGITPVSLAELDVADALHAGPRVGASVVVGTAGDAERLDWTRSLDSVTTMPVACTSGALLLQKGAYDRLDPEVRAVVDDLSSRAEDEGASRVRQDDTAASVRLFRGLAPVEPTASERREWRSFFEKAAEERTGSLLARGLVEDVLGLTHEIDAVE
jgi:TRAP-type C4-dicarboxylate transport system substrate-binding protein